MWKFLKRGLTPPARVSTVGRAYFDVIGLEFVQYLRDFCGLRDSSRVLDVGCGAGRMAIPLMEALGEKGRYAGIDVAAEAIEWCERQITRRRANFEFHRIDAANMYYAPGGSGSGSSYRFPFGDGEFDIVLLASVFTHMLPADMENYLREIRRTLGAGGRCLITYFLLNEESKDRIDRGLYKIGEGRIAVKNDVFWSVDAACPEKAIAYEESYIRRLHADAGLPILEPVRYGYWCQERAYLSFQDIVVAEKSG